jgi:RimJ/RimL family protein N-acetyltransferase
MSRRASAPRTRRRLADGSEIELRPLEPDDSKLLNDVFDQLSQASRRRRFLTEKRSLTAADLRRLTSVDHRDHEAIAALSAADGRPIGVIRFVRSADDPETAEAAVVVVDAWQGRGVGTILVSALLARAEQLRVCRFSVVIAHDNIAVQRLMDKMLGGVKRIAVGGGTMEAVASLPRRAGDPGHGWCVTAPAAG